MELRRESVLIEIPEDAYKQNFVYRPWEEFGQAPSNGSLDNRVDTSVAPEVVAHTKYKLPPKLQRPHNTNRRRDSKR